MMKQDILLAEEVARNRRYCQHCGHSMTFYAFEPTKKLCKHCGRYTYKDKIYEFKDKLRKGLEK